MASKGDIMNEAKKKIYKDRYISRRAELKKMVINPNLSMVEKMDAAYELDRLPKLSSPVKARRRCLITGRANGVYRRFGLSRMTFREAVFKGEIPGIEKASW